MSSASIPSPGDRPEPTEEKLTGTGSLESDLWSLDDEPSAPMPAESREAVGDEMPPINLARVPRVFSGRNDVVTQQMSKQDFGQWPAESKPVVKKPEDAGIRLNIKPQTKDPRPSGQPTRKPAYLRDFTDLEQWADDGGQAKADDALDALPEMVDVPAKPPEGASVAAPEVPVVPETIEPAVQDVEKQSSPIDEGIEIAPKPTGGAARPSWISMLKFTKLEKFGIALLVLALIAVVAGVLIYSRSLPTETAQSRIPKFPIKGESIAVLSATTYWRDVITTGADTDVVRRGTRLLPVMELNCKGGPAMLRLIFRDEFGDSMGDTVNRVVIDGGRVIIPATAGFNDIGMHAAYRTGETKAWKIEVYEGDAGNESTNEFKKLFEMDISTDRR